MKKSYYIFTLMLLAALVSSCGTNPSEKKTVKGTKKVGQFDVSLLNDTEFTPSRSILLGLTPDIQQKYAPDSILKLPVNSFLVKTPSQNILIDAGAGTKLMENLEQAGVQPSEIGTILITHVHFDHVAGLVKNDSVLFPNAKVYISAADMAFIQDDAFINSLPEKNKSGFLLVRKVLQMYAKQIVAFTPGDIEASQKTALVEGIYPIAAPGHTPGHTAFLIDSDQEQLLIWGDLVHYASVQLPHPEVSLVYDRDPEMAKQTRAKLLNYIAAKKITIGGIHIASMGTVASNGNNGYEFTPLAE